jgi:uncharacterized protein YybS (DUF2232 family)
VSVFIPLPVMFYRAKRGRRAAAAIVGVVLGLVGVLGTGPEILFFGALLLIGFLLGELTRSGGSIEKTVGITCGATVAGGSAALMVYGALQRSSLVAMLSEAVRYNLDLTLALYRQTGVSEDQIRALAGSMDQIAQVLVGVMPALAAGSVLIVVWACLLAGRRLCRHFGVYFPEYGALDCWKAPEVLVWGVIASVVLMLLPGLSVKTVGLNGLVLFMIVYFFQGIAIIAFYLEKKQVPRALRLAAYGLIAVQQLIMLAVIAAGFFDTWFNFRRIGKPPAVPRGL